MKPLFTLEELAEMAAADEELEAQPLTMEEIREARERDKAAQHDKKSKKEQRIAENQRAYREANREKIAENQRAYREANREKIAENKRAYREANREKIAENQRAYYEANRERIAENKRAYYEANREKYKAYMREYMRKKRAAEKLSRLRDNAPIILLNTLRDEIYLDAVAHGLWLEGFCYPLDDCAQLIKDEADELMIAADDYEYKDAEKDAFIEELADVIIICFSVAGKLGIDIDAAIRRKMEINHNRPWKHGKE